MSNYQNTITAPHQLHQHTMATLLHIKIGLTSFKSPSFPFATWISISQFILFTPSIFLRILLFDLFISRGKQDLQTHVIISKSPPSSSLSKLQKTTYLADASHHYIVFIHKRTDCLIHTMTRVAQDRDRLTLRCQSLRFHTSPCELMNSCRSLLKRIPFSFRSGSPPRIPF